MPSINGVPFIFCHVCGIPSKVIPLLPLIQPDANLKYPHIFVAEMVTNPAAKLRDDSDSNDEDINHPQYSFSEVVEWLTRATSLKSRTDYSLNQFMNIHLLFQINNM